MFPFYCILCFCKFHYFKLDLYLSTLIMSLLFFFSSNFCFYEFFLGVFVSECLSVYMSICLYVYLSICLPVYMSTCLSVFMSICLSVYLSICLSVYLSTCLSVCYHGILYILTEHTYLKIINDHFTSSIYYIFYYKVYIFINIIIIFRDIKNFT